MNRKNDSRKNRTRRIDELKVGQIVNLGTQTAEIEAVRKNAAGKYDLLVKYQSRLTATWELDLPGEIVLPIV